MPLVVPGLMSEPKKSQDNKNSGDAKASAEHHSANPGPVIPKDTSVLENPASREELKARAAELNKDNKDDKKE